MEQNKVTDDPLDCEHKYNLGIMECAISLEKACTNCGGITPRLSMTLAEFINTYAQNGVRFFTVKRKE